MEIILSKKYTLEITRNKNGLWHKVDKNYPPFVFVVSENGEDKKVTTDTAKFDCWEQYEKHTQNSLKPVYFSYDVGVRKEDLASVTLSVLRILTIFNFQFRLYSNGYLYKETALSRRFKYMIGQSKLRSDEVTKMLSKKEYKRFAKELRENILTQ